MKSDGPRKVVLNALFLDPGASGGPESYLRGLVPALAREYPEVRFTVVTTRSGAEALRGDGWADWLNLRALPCEDGQRVRRQFAEQILLPALARRASADVLHSLASVAPVRAPGTAHVITVHDVTFVHRRTFGRVTTFGMRQIVTRAAHHAQGLISGTAAARSDVARTLELDPDSIDVVHHGLAPPGRAAPTDEVRERYGLPTERPVVLCVAAKRPHKNQELLVRALPLLRADAVLVLAGHPEGYDAELRELAAATGVADRVRFVDYVPDADLEALWSLAAAGAFPTRGEGFGLPVAEALRRGVPVACSDIPVLREVGGPHVLTFGVDDPPGAAAAIDAAIAQGSRGEAERRAWGEQFTWQAAARGTYAVYERACSASA